MHSIQDVVGQFRNSIGGRSHGNDMVGDAFSNFFAGRLNQSKSLDAGESALARLSERFPDMRFGRGTVPAGLDAAREFFKSRPGNQGVVSPDAAEKMESDPSFASSVRDAIQAMMNGGNLFGAVPNAVSSQVGITVTTVTIRYTEIHYGSSGEQLAATDWSGDFQKRLQEMIESIFQIRKPDEEVADSAGDVVADDDADAKRPTLPVGVYAGWSMQVMLSQSMLSLMGGSGGQAAGGAYQAVGMSFGFSMTAFSGQMAGTAEGKGMADEWMSSLSKTGMPNAFSSPFFNNMNVTGFGFMQNSLLYSLSGGRSDLLDLWKFLGALGENAEIAPAVPEISGESGSSEVPDAESEAAATPAVDDVAMPSMA